MASAFEFESHLREVLETAADVEDIGIANITTFRERWLLTNDPGLVIEMEDGTEFQLTIVKSA
jgi:hypothetical protein